MKQILDLAGLWQLRFDEDCLGVNLGWMDQLPENCSQMFLPGCWNEAFPDKKLYDGVVWFFKRIYIGNELSSFQAEMTFEGVGYDCMVWVNSVFCGRHEGGFTAFSVSLAKAIEYGRVNYIAIRVDSKLSDTTIPPSGVDWFNFGGICRDFSLVFKDIVAFRDYRLTTRNTGDVHVLVQIEADNPGHEFIFDIQINDGNGIPIYSEKYKRTGLCFGVDFRIPEPKLWFPGKPYLYTMVLSLKGPDGTDYDRITKRFGFREFSVSGNRILINGKDFRLTGCAKHEDYPLTGRTVSKEQLQKDYALLQQMGANVVRLSHYPHDRKELDILDELGIVAICEAPIVFLKAVQMNDPLIQEKCRTMIRELIRDDGNYTCVMFWSLFIECETFQPEARGCVENLVEYTKKLDPTRLVIMASNRPKKDDSYDLFDVVGINYWSGWYGGESIKDADAFFAWMVRKYPDKPLFITSHGYEGLYGKHDRNALTPWSEEAQADYLSSIADTYMNYQSINGEIIWTFSDFSVSNWNDISATENDNIYLGRPMLFNHKGVVSHERAPKLAYYQMKDKFHKWQNLVCDRDDAVRKCPDPCLSAVYDFIFSVQRKKSDRKIRIWVTWNKQFRRFFEILEKNSPVIPWNRIEFLQFDGVIRNNKNIWGSELAHWCSQFEIKPGLIFIDTPEWFRAVNAPVDYAFLPVNSSGEFGFLDSSDLHQKEDLLRISEFSGHCKRALWEAGIADTDDLEIVTANGSLLRRTEHICGIMNAVPGNPLSLDISDAFYPKTFSRIFMASD